MQHRLIFGAGDLLEMLEVVREKITNGEVDGMTICLTYGDERKGVSHGYAWKDDAPSIWCRMVTSVADAHHDLLTNGLESDV